MRIIGCDFHPSYQQIAMLVEETGEVVEKALGHESLAEVRRFYAGRSGACGWGSKPAGSPSGSSGC